MELTTDQILNAWAAQSDSRLEMQRRLDYFDGKQDILSDASDRYDGHARNLIVTNWIKYLVKKHVGFLLWKPVSVASKDNNDAATEYNAVVRYNNLRAADSQHLAQAILCGYSVEVVSYDGENILSVPYSPTQWAFVCDSDGNPVAGIHCIEIPALTVFEGVVLTEPVTQYTVYTDTSISTYRYIISTDESGDKEKASGALEFISTTPHNFGRLPVVRFAVSHDLATFIGDDLISQQDAYNKVRSRNADDVEYNVDSLLAIKGYDPDALFQLGPDGTPVINKIREQRLLPLKDGGDASFLTKGNDVTKVQSDLELSRTAIHLMGRVADTESIVGATGATSGIALKLKLQPQIEQGTEFTKYFEYGIRERVDLCNTIWRAKNMPTLDNFDVIFTQSIPINEIEIWQGVGYLEPLMSSEDRLSLIPGVENPKEVADRKRQEAEDNSLKFETGFTSTGTADGANTDEQQQDQSTQNLGEDNV